MVYYGVLKDIVSSPKTNDELIQSIVQKMSSIVTEYGIDYVMEHNADHYFDVKNNEIIKLELDPIINMNATEVYKPGWCDCILFNYTKKKFTLMTENKNRHNDLNAPRDIDMSQLSNEELVIWDKRLCSCSDNARHDKNLLNEAKEMLPIGTFFKRTEYIEYDKGNFYRVTGEPYIYKTGTIIVPIMIYDADYYEYKINGRTFIKVYGSKTSFNNLKNVEVLSDNKLVEHIFNNIKDDTFSKSYYTKHAKEINVTIEKTAADIKEYEKELANTTVKSKSLQLQFKIAEAEEIIEEGKKALEECKKFEKDVSSKVEKVKDKIRKAIEQIKKEVNDGSK